MACWNGGQHKVAPRMDNSGRLTEEMTAWFRGEAGDRCLAVSPAAVS